MSLLDVAAALLVALLWGVQFVTSKVGVAAIPPLLFVTLRFAAVAALLLPFAGRPSRREVWAAALVSVFFGGLGFGLFFTGLRLSPAGLSAVIAQLTTPFTVLLAWPVVGDRPTVRVVAGLAVAFAGVALALANPHGRAPAAGILLVTGAAAAQGLGNVLVKRLGPVPPLRLMAWLSLFAAPQLGLASALLEHGQGAALRAAGFQAWLSLAYAVLFGAVVGFALWFRLIGRLPLARVAPFALLQTVFALATGVVVLHEPVTLPLVAGALVCVAGVWLTQTRTGRMPRSAPLHPEVRQRSA